MKKYYLHTFGCQMNVHDSEKIAGLLNSEGLSETDTANDADIVIFNTCSIREKAEQKFYSELGRIKTLKKRRPDLKIAVAGCIAQQEGKGLFKKFPYVDSVVGPQNIDTLRNAIKRAAPVVDTDDNPMIAEMEIPVQRGRGIRAWVNIMYGCDNFCSYCVVPFTRGREKSRASEHIINEIVTLAKQGFKEVTLLGQNVNSYTSKLSFPELLTEINKIETIERIRFVTSHPKDLSNGLIAVMGNLEKVCEHIHLPLQSGSTKILSLMNRRYSYDDYFGKIEKLRRSVPNIAITTDIIAGFPQESHEDHELTLKALNEIQFDGIFAFRYSQRPGTKASCMHDQIDDSIKSERLEEILTLQNVITEKKNKLLIGSEQEILLEGECDRHKERLTGRTRTNKIVTISFDHRLRPGELLKVRITKAYRHSLQGDVGS